VTGGSDGVTPFGSWAKFEARTARAIVSASAWVLPWISELAAARAAASAAFWRKRRSA